MNHLNIVLEKLLNLFAFFFFVEREKGVLWEGQKGY